MADVPIQEVLKTALDKWGGRNFIYMRVEGAFIPKTFRETTYDVWALAQELLALGLKNKHILIFSENSYAWCILDLAIMGFVGVTVAANADWKERDLENVIDIADVECVIYSDSKSDIVESVRKKKPGIRYISIQDDLPSLLKQGYELLAEKSSAGEFEKRSTREMSKIVFTSGTTSASKAVMLGGKNLFFGFDSLYRRAPMGESDSIYLFLPLSHTFGGIYNLLVSLYFGMELYLSSDVGKIFEELQMVNPSVFCSVPFIYERAYLTLGAGIKNAFGRNIKYMFCGGAKCNLKIRKFYKDMGLNILEAYALTETSSSFSIEYSGSKRVGSVGTVFEDIEVKFSDTDENGHGEILVRGDNVALGYYNNEEETQKVFDADGYFHTGDIGYMNEDGELFLVGRKKRLIRFSNARSVYPEELEELLTQSDIIQAAFVYEKDGKITADLVSSADKKTIDLLVEELNETLPRYKRIGKTVITDSIHTKLVKL